MTYLELAKMILNEFNEEQQQSDVTIRDVDLDEYHKTSGVSIMRGSDVLDEGHPVLKIFDYEQQPRYFTQVESIPTTEMVECFDCAEWIEKDSTTVLSIAGTINHLCSQCLHHNRV